MKCEMDQLARDRENAILVRLVCWTSLARKYVRIVWLKRNVLRLYHLPRSANSCNLIRFLKLYPSIVEFGKMYCGKRRDGNRSVSKGRNRLVCSNPARKKAFSSISLQWQIYMFGYLNYLKFIFACSEDRLFTLFV